ncbi:hypothetical protein EB796_014621 [Bugula neritina]|uniref:Uncharacterized protein n=1 Tax=Bugula neritina TaxID=10212 RepID=A0A7J7JLB5_BUGNE|nr:hypothetical protein EB796_014621 [Bugula neritina]
MHLSTGQPRTLLHIHLACKPCAVARSILETRFRTDSVVSFTSEFHGRGLSGTARTRRGCCCVSSADFPGEVSFH